MSVVRAILGRFARFLVRIARTLDPGVAATPYWAMPERMAALRQRYPGAPEHWLELIARRTGIGATPQAPAVRPGPEMRRNDQRPQFEPPESTNGPPQLRIGPSRSAARPAPRFPGPVPKTPVTARPPVATAEARSDPEIPPAASRTIRPLLTFGSVRVRNPVANLLRGGPPKDRPAAHFGDSAQPTEHDPSARPDELGAARREHVTEFRQPHPVPPLDPDWIEQRPAGQRPADAGWPEFRHSVPPGSSWPNDPARTARYNPRFAASDNRWPELPPLVNESETPLLRASDEAALLAEQMGGTWSA